MKYHPLAEFIIEILEKKVIRYTKDLYEMSYIQSETGVAEKFASVSVTTLVKSFKKELQKHYHGTLYTSTIFSTLDEDIFGNKPMRLLFNPIDSFINFSRGIQNFGISFLLQEAINDGIRNVFSISYSFQGQEIIYSDAVGSYNRGRLLKGILRKTPKLSVASYNTHAIIAGKFLDKFKQIQASNSIINDLHHICSGKYDVAIYNNIPLVYTLPMNLLAKNLGVLPKKEEIMISKDLAGIKTDVIYANKYILEAISKD